MAMAKNMKLGLLLLALVLLSCTAVHARIMSGESTDGGHTKGEAKAMLFSGGRFTGCYRNSLPTPAWVFCCIKDENCWTSLSACRSECG
ncbi:hypothetical protein EJB05_09805 [Eragrostis curvula]|uniref:Embryo surrounding factor 1 brassicaceae domain-containing protein n=1 Tax=Eragrostis curvula TaxID=38414 RepID=A0A5J9W5W0_9POAL|nr:hypothetical protein EJB05_09805 [Eragrostis curvula]